MDCSEPSLSSPRPAIDSSLGGGSNHRHGRHDDREQESDFDSLRNTDAANSLGKGRRRHILAAWA